MEDSIYTAFNSDSLSCLQMIRCIILEDFCSKLRSHTKTNCFGNTYWHSIRHFLCIYKSGPLWHLSWLILRDGQIHQAHSLSASSPGKLQLLHLPLLLPLCLLLLHLLLLHLLFLLLLLLCLPSCQTLHKSCKEMWSGHWGKLLAESYSNFRENRKLETYIQTWLCSAGTPHMIGHHWKSSCQVWTFPDWTLWNAHFTLNGYLLVIFWVVLVLLGIEFWKQQILSV